MQLLATKDLPGRICDLPGHISSLIPLPAGINPTQLYTFKETCSLTGLEVYELSRMIHKDKLGFYLTGGRILFLGEDIINILKQYLG